jgi:hypothetical protein
MRAWPHPDVLSGAALLFVAAGYGYIALGIPSGEHDPGPRFLPIVLAAALGGIAVFIIVSSLRAVGAGATPPTPAGPTEVHRREFAAWTRPLLAAVMTAAYAWSLQPLGFAVSTVAYVAAITAMLSTARTQLLIVPPLVTLALYVFFDVALGVRLP